MRRGLQMAAVAALCLPSPAVGQSWREVTMSRQLEGNEPVRVRVEYGSGRFTVRPVDEGVLYRMHLRYDEEQYEPVSDFSGGVLHLGTERVARNVDFDDDSGELDLELARGIPMDLDLEFGAVKAEIDLGGLALTELDLSTGASESIVRVSEPNPSAMDAARFEIGAAEFTARQLGNLNAERIDFDAGVGELTLWLDGRWRRDAALSIDMGLGALELRIPEGLGVRLRKDSFLTTLDSEGLVKRGDAYYSLDWEDASRKVTIDLDAAFGSVAVVWIR